MQNSNFSSDLDEPAHSPMPVDVDTQLMQGLQCVLSHQVSRSVEAALAEIAELCINDEPPDGSARRCIIQQKTVQFNFKLPDMVLHFYDVFALHKHFGTIFKAFYFVKDCQLSNTFLLHFKLNGYAPRSRLSQATDRLIQAMACAPSQDINIKHMSHCSNNGNVIASLFRERAGYLKENIYIILRDESDSHIYTAPYMNKLDVVNTVKNLKKLYTNNMAKICLAPHAFDTVLRSLYNLSPWELKQRFKERDLDAIYREVQCQVFDMSVTEASESEEDRLVLGTECVRLQVCDTQHDTVYQMFLRCVLGTTNTQVEHPSIYYSMRKHLQVLFSAPTADVSMYHSDFLVPLLLVARYVARVGMQDMASVSSNGAALLMYGAAGAGKSIITNSLARYLHGYKWNADTLYQTPDLLSASVIIIEEARLSQMCDPLYKQLLDITSYVKVEIKHAHPVDATRHCPVILNTNEHVYDYLRGMTQNGNVINQSNGYNHHQSQYGRKTRSMFTDEQLAAVRRRLVIVPFVEKFSHLHEMPDFLTQDPCASASFANFCNMEVLEPQIFNFFIAFGLYQTQLAKFEVVISLQDFMEKVAAEFTATVFGQVYLQNKSTIDQLLDSLELCLNGAAAVQSNTTDRDMFKAFCKVSEQLNTMIDNKYLELINQCDEKSRTQMNLLWNKNQWYENSRFMRKILVQENDAMKNILKKGKIEKQMVAYQWRHLLSIDSTRAHSHNSSVLAIDDEEDDDYHMQELGL